MSNVLEIRGLTKHYPVGGAFARSLLHAADDVSLSIAPGETVGLVGESGSGKSTVGRCILRLEEPTSGEILLNGESVVAATSSRLRVMRANMQMVFQDPYDSLNPRIKVGELVAEPLWLSGIMSRKEADRKVAEVFDLVHLPTDTPLRYAHQLSGGQQQRVGIARALATNPDLVVLDEPTSALDVSVQAQIINLLEEIRQRLSPAYLFISHDLSVVSNLSDRVAVMYLGQIVEVGPTDTIFELPGHPYTRGLISAAPVEHPAQQKERLTLLGEPTSPVDPKPGCRLASRCPFVEPKCREGELPLQEITPGHSVRCRRYVEEHVDGVWDPEPTR
ncbi:MAG: ABC transporter ATP-binding protein [Trueperaceae bacterium]|nr:MAG: ABC transporter ATP-binding protein [Trueperaceae bacterium]